METTSLDTALILVKFSATMATYLQPFIDYKDITGVNGDSKLVRFLHETKELSCSVQPLDRPTTNGVVPLRYEFVGPDGTVFPAVLLHLPQSVNVFERSQREDSVISHTFCKGVCQELRVCCSEDEVNSVIEQATNVQRHLVPRIDVPSGSLPSLSGVCDTSAAVLERKLVPHARRASTSAVVDTVRAEVAAQSAAQAPRCPRALPVTIMKEDLVMTEDLRARFDALPAASEAEFSILIHPSAAPSSSDIEFIHKYF